ncbi:uncharacterized protein LOC100898738 [Galendromus occidentalis]|uniref:Uncharacterized protein LOC100898738 n=1 Tax=Galendromus occidentalis TaxID=34638 RepID=A0AAJ6VWG5_9ACAR|nr:uncharacterized protein LOC100898738 [Galendromus occidentalis]
MNASISACALLLAALICQVQHSQSACSPVGYCPCRTGVDRFGCLLCLCFPCNLCCPRAQFSEMIYWTNIGAYCPRSCYRELPGLIIDGRLNYCPAGYNLYGL